MLDQRIFGVCSLLSALASRSPGGISPIALVAMTSLRQRVLHRCGRKGTHARTHYESAPAHSKTFLRPPLFGTSGAQSFRL